MKLIINGKAVEVSSGTNFQHDDTIVNTDGVYSVSTPVQGAVTQSDWDAMDEQIKAKGLWIINDGNGGG